MGARNWLFSKKLDPIREFREDHRKVRDGVLSLADALKAKDIKKAREVLGELNVVVGPHFRYEEEYLYPEIRKFLGEYVEQLLTEHDKALATAKTAAGLLTKDKLTDAEFESAKQAALAILVHVSNCDGIAILSERLDSKELKALGEKYAGSRKANVPLLEWADKIRQRRFAA